MGIPNRYLAATDGSPHHIGNQPVSRPVSATDYVAGTSRGDTRVRASFTGAEEGLAKSGGNQFSSGLAAGIWIEAAQTVALPKGLRMFLSRVALSRERMILVTLIRGNDHHRLHRGRRADGFEDIRRSEHVG